MQIASHCTRRNFIKIDTDVEISTYPTGYVENFINFDEVSTTYFVSFIIFFREPHNLRIDIRPA